MPRVGATAWACWLPGGMTGWMNACRTLAPQPAPPAPPTRGAGNHALAEGAGELVAVMAAMALAHL